jgi:hypothetical protein
MDKYAVQKPASQASVIIVILGMLILLGGAGYAIYLLWDTLQSNVQKTLRDDLKEAQSIMKKLDAKIDGSDDTYLTRYNQTLVDLTKKDDQNTSIVDRVGTITGTLTDGKAKNTLIDKIGTIVDKATDTKYDGNDLVDLIGGVVSGKQGALTQLLDSDDRITDILNGIQSILDGKQGALTQLLDSDDRITDILNGIQGILDGKSDALKKLLDDTRIQGILNGIQGILDGKSDALKKLLDGDTRIKGILDGTPGALNTVLNPVVDPLLKSLRDTQQQIIQDNKNNKIGNKKTGLCGLGSFGLNPGPCIQAQTANMIKTSIDNYLKSKKTSTASSEEFTYMRQPRLQRAGGHAYFPVDGVL